MIKIKVVALTNKAERALKKENKMSFADRIEAYKIGMKKVLGENPETGKLTLLIQIEQVQYTEEIEEDYTLQIIKSMHKHGVRDSEFTYEVTA